MINSVKIVLNCRVCNFVKIIFQNFDTLSETILLLCTVDQK